MHRCRSITDILAITPMITEELSCRGGRVTGREKQDEGSSEWPDGGDGGAGWGHDVWRRSAIGQFAGPAVSWPATGAAAPVSALRAQYRDVKIMPGDVIAIATYGAPELTTTTSTSIDTPGSANGGGSVRVASR